MPNEVVEANTVNAFKYRLDKPVILNNADDTDNADNVN